MSSRDPSIDGWRSPRFLAGVGMAVALSLLLAVSTVSIIAMRYEAQARAWVEHTHRVLERCDALGMALVESESAARGHVLTSDAQLRSAYRADAALARGIAAELAELTNDNPAQRERIERLRRSVDGRLGLLERLTEPNPRPDETATGLVLEGSAAMRDLRAQMDAVVDAELALLRARDQQVARGQRATMLFVAVGGALAFLSVGGSGMLMRQALALRSRAQRALAAANEQLEAKVAERTRDLAESERTYRFLAEAMPQIVWTARPDGGIDYFNRVMSEYIGKPSDTALGDAWAASIHPDDLPEVLRRQRVVLASGAPFEAEFRLRRGDGEHRWFLSRACAMRDGDGRILRWFGTSTDIHDQRVAFEQLRSREQALLRSNEELEQFAYVSAHDLQEPLRMISSYLQLIERRLQGTLDPKTREHLDYVVANAQRVRAMIAGILDYSLIGREGRARAPVPADEAARDALAGLDRLIGESGAAVRLSPLPSVLADRAQLTRLFQNLLANALKFSERTPEISVSADRDPDQPEFRRFAIADRGIGIDARSREDIFRIFHRLNPNGRFPGTGIGLAACRKIVESHGGRIWVEANPAGGSVFLFTLPDAP